MRLRVLSAGAAQGVVTALAGAHGIELEAQFGAVGTMKEKLDDGAPCDLIVLTRAQINALQAQGRASACADLGRVRTGVAVRAGDPAPVIGTPDELRAALLAAEAIYFPDPQKATAGIHFAKVLDALEVREALKKRFRAYPNGATAMREMALAAGIRAIGCTQITEINQTPGVTLVGPLPKQFELATVYSAAVCGSSDAGKGFLALLTGDASRALRSRAGFEF